MDKRDYVTEFFTEIGSVDDIREYLSLELYLSAQARGIDLITALEEHGMTFKELVSNRWGNFFNEDVSFYINSEEVRRTSPLISHNGSLSLVEIDKEEIE